MCLNRKKTKGCLSLNTYISDNTGASSINRDQSGIFTNPQYTILLQRETI